MAQPTSASLNAEIMSDPKGIGYGTFVSGGSDTDVARLLNSTYAGVGVVYRSDLMPQEVLKSLVWTEVNIKPQTHLTILQMLLQPRMIDTSESRIRDLFIGMFPSGSTLANLTAVAQVVNPTRAEELWGNHTTISITEVAHALGR
jgi:hypothetical protein